MVVYSYAVLSRVLQSHTTSILLPHPNVLLPSIHSCLRSEQSADQVILISCSRNTRCGLVQPHLLALKAV
jgi:hypothetical protein